jgi:drug/metabolite transporter (DMT)-like permease
MPLKAATLTSGIFFSLAAGMLWGLVFVGPLLLPDYPAAMQTFGRYFAFGLMALPLAYFDRADILRLTRSDWLTALKLGAIGNIFYYLFLSSAILRSGGALPTMIIGTLPVVIAVAANYLSHQRDGHFPWIKLAAPLALILVGIACVNHAEWQAFLQNPLADTTRYITGALYAVAAMLCWTWYPIKNADWMRGNPGRSSRVWATAQGLATLPLAMLGYAGFWLWASATDYPIDMPLGPRPLEFVSLMVAIGLLASWLGTLCWNAASQRLPTALAGQLIVFETLAALSYAFALRGQWPEPVTLLGIALLVAGVIGGVRVKPIRTV